MFFLHLGIYFVCFRLVILWPLFKWNLTGFKWLCHSTSSGKEFWAVIRTCAIVKIATWDYTIYTFLPFKKKYLLLIFYPWQSGPLFWPPLPQYVHMRPPYGPARGEGGINFSKKSSNFQTKEPRMTEKRLLFGRGTKERKPHQTVTATFFMHAAACGQHLLKIII